MADTFSALLNLRLQQTGNNNNTWGDLLNSDTITPLENAISGIASHAIGGATLDLSATPMVEQVHKFTGVLAADCIVTIPNLSKRMKLWNATTGGFFVLVKTAAGTSVCIPQGTLKDVYCDGANNVFREDRNQVGEIIYFGGTSAPSGYFAADGSAKIRASTPDLFGYIGTTWGVGNGTTTYNLPDLVTSNRFLRSSGGALTVGTYQAQDVQPHAHTTSVSNTLGLSIASDGAHSHTGTTDPGGSHGHTNNFGGVTAVGANAAGINGYAAGGLGTVPNSFTNLSIDGAPNHTHNFTTAGVAAHAHAGSSITGSIGVTVNNSSGSETRPASAVALACIRY